MPAKNSLKDYAPDSYYHVYNRGVAKQDIFLDEQDYKTFLSYLKLGWGFICKKYLGVGIDCYKLDTFYIQFN